MNKRTEVSLPLDIAEQPESVAGESRIRPCEFQRPKLGATD